MSCAMAVVGFGVLASCTSGDIPGGEDPQGQYGGQANATAGSGQVGSVAGSTAAAGAAVSGVAGAPVGAAGAAQGTAGSGMAAGGAQGQSGSTSVAGNGAGGASAGASAGGKGGTSGTAGAMSGTAGAMSGTAGAATGPQPLPSITGGSSGFATRYWDCCKPACGGGNLTCGKDGTTKDGGGSACSGGSGFMCYNFAPFQDTTNKYVSYAFAASHRNCGSCWELQFTGKAGCSEGSTCPGKATGLVYNTVFVQVINTGAIADDQFDLLIPGGGVGQFNACSNEWGVMTSDLGSTYGGFLAGCNGSVSCTQTKCNTVFAGKPDLLAGCNWFLNWYGAGDNPQITFKSVSCPSQLTSKSGISG